MRTIKRVVATGLQKKLEHGRTRPAVFTCEDSDGAPAGEFVVKFKASCDSGVTAMTCELISSLLADELGLLTPAPALVELSSALADSVSSVDPELGAVVKASCGLNFGSQFLAGGFLTWLRDRPLPASLQQLAFEIFVFDAFIQNADRRFDKPNLLWKGDEMVIIDHEMACSFLYTVGPSSEPWKVDEREFDFLQRHVFYQALKGKKINANRLMGAIAQIDNEILSEIFSSIPAEWRNDKLIPIQTHLETMIEHKHEFIVGVLRRLV